MNPPPPPRHSLSKMAKELRMIDQIQVAKPCPANWDEMKGDDAIRHCSLCRLNVYNFSEMSETQIEKLLGNSEGRVCGRFYRRQDGTVITKDCPRGVRALRMKAVKQLAIAASFVLTIVGCGSKGEQVKKALGVDIIENTFRKEQPLVGAIACPPTPPPTTSKSTPPVAPSTKSMMMGEIAAPRTLDGRG